MAIIRINNHDKPYTIISNHALQDPRLTLRARGLLYSLLSLPPNWKLMIEDLIKRFPEGEKAIYSALRELKSLGYVEHRRKRDDKGLFTEGEYIVYETPQMVDSAPTEDIDKEILASPTLSSSSQTQSKSHVKQARDAATRQVADENNNNASHQDSYACESQPLSSLRHVDKRDDVLGDAIENKEYTHNTEKKKHSSNRKSLSCDVKNFEVDARYAAEEKKSYSSVERKIGSSLTTSQRARTRHLAHAFWPNTFFEDFPTFVEALEQSMLNPEEFTRAGNDFAKKLNTIRKCLKNNLWLPPLDFERDDVREHKQKQLKIHDDFMEASHDLEALKAMYVANANCPNMQDTNHAIKLQMEERAKEVEALKSMLEKLSVHGKTSDTHAQDR